MNQETEEDNKIKWKNFKNLKTEYSINGDSMDLCDLANFYKSFKDLYPEQIITPEIISCLKENIQSLQREFVIQGMRQH